MAQTSLISTDVDKMSWPAKVHQAVMTPINFITFLVSLYLVDSHYRAQRERQHHNQNRSGSSRPWLHRVLFRARSPYSWVDDYGVTPAHIASKPTATKAENTPGRIEVDRGHWFYHTKQKKLLRLEAADAFALRNSVFLGLCIVALVSLLTFWRTSLWLGTLAPSCLATIRSGHPSG
ncbi:hypothetical protein F5Y18DRAFT_137861 [Xylariaceae sp. FL1019]|nr:hypothetical protein F5Y18DRAFT_137861 [Xylariaceae sp. FL1019]